MIPLPDGKFDLIAADPNWKFKTYSEKDMSRSADAHYDCIPVEEICELNVPDIAANDCHLMLWITGPMLVIGAHLPIFSAWGFTPSSLAFVWVKNTKKSVQGRFFEPMNETHFKMGMGHTTRQNAELVVLGRKGNPKRHSKAIRQIIVEPAREHSRKPDQFYTSCQEYAGPQARLIELHSRQRRAGWTSWNAIKGQLDTFPMLVGNNNENARQSKVGGQKS